KSNAVTGPSLTAAVRRSHGPRQKNPEHSSWGLPDFYRPCLGDIAPLRPFSGRPLGRSVAVRVFVAQGSAQYLADVAAGKVLSENHLPGTFVTRELAAAETDHFFLGERGVACDGVQF